ncbi:unnamed protein product [Candidula unifasciata]|uniref:NADH dehydrogenase [ubiquinone] 1 subunit C2 n=1 Tax=Candidula unifasciata TaxID=100452 RepID=A0A8S3Z0F5_9EUPU|nr:unnamed protein product [Candidula unifasciata]
MVGPEITRRLPYYEGLRFSVENYFGVGIFLGASLLHNYLTKRPIGAAIPKHLASAVAGYLIGNEADKYLDNRRSQQVSVIEDYICRHPEDFPRVRAKKYKDILLPWIPVR